MVFDPDNYEAENDRYPLVPNGEYLLMCKSIEYKIAASGYEYILMEFNIEQAYDADNTSWVNKSFRLSFGVEGDFIKYYYNLCKGAGVPRHSEKDEREDDRGTPGLKDVWLNRAIVGKVRGKYSGKYQNYSVFSPRPLTDAEAEAYSGIVIGVDNESIPF